MTQRLALPIRLRARMQATSKLQAIEECSQCAFSTLRYSTNQDMLPWCQQSDAIAAALMNINKPSLYAIAPAQVLCIAVPALFINIASPYTLAFGLHPSGICTLHV